RCEAGPVGTEAAGTQDRFVAGHHLDGGRALVRVHADDHPARCAAQQSSVARSDRFVEPGGQRYFEPSKPHMSLSQPWGDARDSAGQMRATQPSWAAEMRATARTPGPSLAGPRSYHNETSELFSSSFGLFLGGLKDADRGDDR